MAEAARRLESLVEPILFHVPTWRLRAEIDLHHDNQRWDGCRSKHPTPLGVLAEDGEILEGNGDDETNADTESSPHLPHHSKGTTNVLRGGLGRIDRSSGGFGTDSETKHESSSKEIAIPIRRQ